CSPTQTNTATVFGFCTDAKTAPQTASCETHCVPPPPPGRCWLTGGGQSYDAASSVHSGSDLHSYGGAINPGSSPPAARRGHWNDLDHTTGADFKGEEITVMHCGNVPGIPAGSLSPKTDVNYILFTGTGEMFPPGNKKRVAVTFYGFYEDRHEPGSLGQTDEA